MIRLIGDIHGHYRRYLDLISNCDYSIQLGDFGFDYRCIEQVDCSIHKILLGNHENYSNIPINSLGDFGYTNHGGLNIFYIRGAYSIDKQYRTPFFSWFPEEELSFKQAKECIELYAKTKPNFVISHDCPLSVYPYIVNNPHYILETQTAKLLQECLDIHQPRFWRFAHHHKSITLKTDKTEFRCLAELEYEDISI